MIKDEKSMFHKAFQNNNYSKKEADLWEEQGKRR